MTDHDFSISEWCTKRRLSIPIYYKLKRQGKAPQTITLPGTTVIRITARADREWEQAMRKLSDTQEARRAEERRKELASVAGKAATQSEAWMNRNRKRRRVSDD